MIIDTIETKISDPSVLGKKLYFANELCEWQLVLYNWSGCTSVQLRDEVMSHATELIRQIIRKQGLHTIYPGQEESAFGDLLQVAWCVVPNTFVMTSGGIVEIGDILPDGPEGECNFEIFGKDGISVAEYFVRRPPTKTYKIALKSGYNLEATGEHPIWTLTDDGPKWVPASDLKIGDLVAVQAGQNVGSPQYLDMIKNNTPDIFKYAFHLVQTNPYLVNRLRVLLLNSGIYTDTSIVEEDGVDNYLLKKISDCSTDLEIRWFPVESITNGFSETVDIRVRDTHNFTANGIVVQNCQVERTLYKYRARAHCRNCFKYDRPSESVLYEPAPREYGIITMDQVIKQIRNCPRCGVKLSAQPIVLPKQGTFGGSETILYRGCSKVFNLWCVEPDTMIYTTNGLDIMQNVVDRVGHGEEIWTLGLCGNPRKIAAGMSKPERDILRIKTLSGYTIGCTPQHSLMCIDGWKQASELRLGDLIGIEYNQQFFIGDDCIDVNLTPNKHGCSGVKSPDWDPPDYFNAELAYILGLYVAEGSLGHGQVTIYNIDADIIDKLVNNTLGLKFTHHPNSQCIVCCNKRFVEFVDALGFGYSATQKRIPQKLLKMSKSNIIAMLSGMFDGDGHSSRHNGTVGYTSTSKMLIDQVRMLLLNLGMLTKISTDTRDMSTFNRRGKKYSSKKNLTYQIGLSSNDSVVFYNDIGFACQRKQDKQRLLKPRKRFIHGINNSIRLLSKKYGYGKLGFNKVRSAIKPWRKYCEISYAKQLLDNWNEHSGDADYEFLRTIISQFIADGVRTVWLPIVSITKSRSPVYEISVESDDHSYIANGIISHNSQVSRTVILAYIKKEARDRKNCAPYTSHLTNKPKPIGDMMSRFLTEAKSVCQYHDDYIKIVDALDWIIHNDERPYNGIISKLVKRSNLSRSTVINFIRYIKLRSCDFTDSPISRNISENQPDRSLGESEFDDE